MGLGKEFHVHGNVDSGNTSNFLRAMVALVVHIGYAGPIVIFEEAELLSGMSCPDSRHAASENRRSLLDQTAQAELPRWGFI